MLVRNDTDRRLPVQLPRRSLVAVLSGRRPLVLVRTHRLKDFRRRGYTFGMKTAISIPDEVFAGAERLARRQRKSRSQLYSEAIEEYVARHDPDAITDAMDRVCEDVGGESDAAVSAAARRALKRSEWK